MIVLSLTEQRIHDLWDDIERKHPWGPMELGCREPSKYLLRAHELGLVSWENALELLMASTGIGEPAPERAECGKSHA